MEERYMVQGDAKVYLRTLPGLTQAIRDAKEFAATGPVEVRRVEVTDCCAVCGTSVTVDDRNLIVDEEGGTVCEDWLPHVYPTVRKAYTVERQPVKERGPGWHTMRRTS